jgi:predicted transglutaminase-like cysteine proteinase
MSNILKSIVAIAAVVAAGSYQSANAAMVGTPRALGPMLKLISLSDPTQTPIPESSPVLAPFQHVRFCLRYPSDCKSDPSEDERVNFSEETAKLLDSVNRDVNGAISPTVKDYGSNSQDGWAISPVIGDCNDYAVTKRHELLKSGLPAKALRLSVVKTTSGIGHLVLVVVTTKGELVLDNLTETIRLWQNTDYHWLKIQSASDARFWYEIKTTSPAMVQVSHTAHKIRLADR